MDPAVLGGIIGGGTLLTMFGIVYVCERIYKPKTTPVQPKQKRHWKMKNLLPVYNEEYRSESYPLREGTHIELNGKPDLRSHILRVSRGSRFLPTENDISKV